MHITCLSESSKHAASSCKEIKELKPKSLFGYYWIKASGNSSIQLDYWWLNEQIDTTNSSH